MRAVQTSDYLVFLVVNGTNVAQSVGFLSRPSGSDVQWIMGLAIVGMSIPAGVAVALDSRLTLPAWQRVGPWAFIAFAAFSAVVNYVLDVEFRDPRKPAILIPFLTLFFGSILLLGLRLFPVSKSLWAITAVTTAVLVGSMIWAQLKGVG